MFLFQDMFPVIARYIDGQYIKGGQPVRIVDPKLIQELEKNAKKIINLLYRGVRLSKWYKENTAARDLKCVLLRSKPISAPCLRVLKEEFTAPAIDREMAGDIAAIIHLTRVWMAPEGMRFRWTFVSGTPQSRETIQTNTFY